MNQTALHIGFLREPVTSRNIEKLSEELGIACTPFTKLGGHLNFFDIPRLPPAIVFENLGIVIFRPKSPLLADSKLFSDAFIEPSFLAFGAPEVRYQPRIAKLTESEGVSWGLLETGVLDSGLTGAGIRVCVIDSGIDLHPDLKTLSGHRSFAHVPTTDDSMGHGTFNAGIIAGSMTPRSGPRYGVAPNALLFNAKVFGPGGKACTASLLAAIEWALQMGCHIASMSIGDQLSGSSSVHTYMAAAAQRALSKGLLIIAGSGNDSDREATPFNLFPVAYPANCAGVMAVAAVNSKLEIWSKSNPCINGTSGFVDIAAPGVAVTSAGRNGTYKMSNGTSIATPYVAGIAALYAEHCGARGQKLWDLVVNKAKPLPSQHVDDVGVGLVRAPDVSDARACAPR